MQTAPTSNARDASSSGGDTVVESARDEIFHLILFKAVNGHVRVPLEYAIDNSVDLGKWVKQLCDIRSCIGHLENSDLLEPIQDEAAVAADQRAELRQCFEQLKKDAASLHEGPVPMDFVLSQLVDDLVPMKWFRPQEANLRSIQLVFARLQQVGFGFDHDDEASVDDVGQQQQQQQNAQLDEVGSELEQYKNDIVELQGKLDRAIQSDASVKAQLEEIRNKLAQAAEQDTNNQQSIEKGTFVSRNLGEDINSLKDKNESLENQNSRLETENAVLNEAFQQRTTAAADSAANTVHTGEEKKADDSSTTTVQQEEQNTSSLSSSSPHDADYASRLKVQNSFNFLDSFAGSSREVVDTTQNGNHDSTGDGDIYDHKNDDSTSSFVENQDEGSETSNDEASLSPWPSLRPLYDDEDDEGVVTTAAAARRLHPNNQASVVVGGDLLSHRDDGDDDLNFCSGGHDDTGNDTGFTTGGGENEHDMADQDNIMPDLPINDNQEDSVHGATGNGSNGIPRQEYKSSLTTPEYFDLNSYAWNLPQDPPKDPCFTSTRRRMPHSYKINMKAPGLLFRKDKKGASRFAFADNDLGMKLLLAQAAKKRSKQKLEWSLGMN